MQELQGGMEKEFHVLLTPNCKTLERFRKNFPTTTCQLVTFCGGFAPLSTAVSRRLRPSDVRWSL
jgi:hypothetical protein